MKKQELLGLQLKKVDYKKDFYLLYQPQVRCCDGVMIGVEALLRWKAPDGAVISPLDFIRVIRLKRAAELLQEGELRINEICDRVGFQSPSYFAKIFQKQFGVTPTEFMQKKA